MFFCLSVCFVLCFFWPESIFKIKTSIFNQIWPKDFVWLCSEYRKTWVEFSYKSQWEYCITWRDFVLRKKTIFGPPLSAGGSIVSQSPVCPSVLLSVQNFSCKLRLRFFRLFLLNARAFFSKTVRVGFFRKVFIWGYLGKRKPKMAQKRVYLIFYGQKMSFDFPESNQEWIKLFVFSHKPHIGQNFCD